MKQDELTPDWLALRHRLTFALRRLRGGSRRLSKHSRGDLRAGVADRARPAIRASCTTRCRRNRFTPSTLTLRFSSNRRIFPPLIADPEIIGLHISPKGPRQTSRLFPAASMLGGGEIWLERVQSAPARAPPSVQNV